MFKRVRDLRVTTTLIIPMIFLMSFISFIININNDSIFFEKNKDLILINNASTAINNEYIEATKDNKNIEFLNVKTYIDIIKNLESNAKSKNISKIDNLRNEINNKYNINIYYKNEMNDYNPVPEYNISKLYDEDIIYKKLTEINDILSKFPVGFFNESSKFHLNIYLIQKFDKSNYAGLTESNYANSKAVITLTNTLSTSNVLYHELMHYIHFYIVYKNKIDPFIDIEKFNPSDFKYGDKNDNYVYKKGYSLNNKYFIDSYSQTLYYEDVATIFESLMLYDVKPEYYDNYSVIYNKAKFINEIIKSNFQSTSGYNRWERFIK